MLASGEAFRRLFSIIENSLTLEATLRKSISCINRSSCGGQRATVVTI